MTTTTARRAPHHTGRSTIQRNEHGRQETRSASLRIRIEPTLLARARQRAQETAPDWTKYSQRGAVSDYIRALIIADLEA